MPEDNRLKITQAVCILILLIALGASVEKAFPAARSAEWTATSMPPLVVDRDFFSAYEPPSGNPAALPSIASATPLISTSPAEAKANPPQDIISADEYLVGNLQTGQIYFEKDPDAIQPIASISKLFDALVVMKYIDPNEEIAVSSSSMTGYEQVPTDIHPGETYTAGDLLRGMIMISSNDAALAFANAFGYKAYMSDMNAQAASLGMTETSFMDPSGLSPGNVSTASDLFKLARYLYSSDPSLLAITRMPEFDVATTSLHDAHDFVNIDPFVYDPHYLGGKTGRSDQAGETMLSLFNLPTADGSTTPVAIIVLHSDIDERQIDSSVLLKQVLSMIKG